jgi:hypothetical protein
LNSHRDNGRKTETSTPPGTGEEDWEYLLGRRREPVKAPVVRARSGPSAAVVLAIIVSAVAIVLWFPVGLKYLERDNTSLSSNQSYKEWLLSSAKNSVASQMYRAASRIGRCVDANDASCACAVSMPDVTGLASEVSQRWDQAGVYRSAHTALSGTVTAYQELQKAHSASCPSAISVASLRTAIDRYQTNHNAFVDAIDRIEMGK